jgi:hypothetical protein
MTGRRCDVHRGRARQRYGGPHDPPAARRPELVLRRWEGARGVDLAPFEDLPARGGREGAAQEDRRAGRSAAGAATRYAWREALARVDLSVSAPESTVKTLASQEAWTSFESARRDVCYCYHDLAKYRFVDAEFLEVQMLNEPYWEFLDLEPSPGKISEPDRLLVRHGSLVIILAGLFAEVSNTIHWFGRSPERMLSLRRAVEAFSATDERESRIIFAIRAALENRDAPDHWKELVPYCERAYDDFVKSYFVDRAAGPSCGRH